MTRPRWRQWLGVGLLAVWAPVALVVIALLMVNHVVAMPEPSDVDRLHAAVEALVGGRADRRAVVHVIYAGCSCTDGLVTHLDTRGPGADTDEVVLYVGADAERQARLAARGFRVEPLPRSELEERFALRAAPILVVLEPEGELAYVGGYYRYPAAVHALDEQILARIDGGERPEGLPIFGCAVDPALARQLDPLGLQELQRQ